MIYLLNNHDTIWNAALKILSRRDHSESELRQKLHQKDYKNEEIDQVIVRLVPYGYINDTKFAKNLFEKYLRLNKYSFNIILGKLKQHGITDAIIQNVTNGHKSEEEWQSALKLALHRFKVLDATNREKIYRFLGTRGFSTTTIHKVFQQMEMDHDDME